MNDRIRIDDLRVWTVVGVHPRERTFPRPLRLWIELELDLDSAARRDELDATVDYDWLCRRVRRQVESTRRSTLEAVAGDVLSICLEDARVQSARVRVDKPQAVRGVATVSVEMQRRRGES